MKKDTSLLLASDYNSLSTTKVHLQIQEKEQSLKRLVEDFFHFFVCFSSEYIVIMY